MNLYLEMYGDETRFCYSTDQVLYGRSGIVNVLHQVLIVKGATA